MMNKPKIWITTYFSIVGIALIIVGLWTVRVDPFFHFHKPNISEYFYPLNNQRSQNNGISRNFDYQGLITGTSMTENFKTSEAGTIFGGDFIKVSFSGGSYKEINDNIKVALSQNRDLRTIIRGLDMGMFFNDKDFMRKDLGIYPTYLYDRNIFNDVQYVFNRDVIFLRVYPMIKESNEESFQGGITSFDAYSNWMDSWKFGRTVLYPDGVVAQEPTDSIEITKNERDTVLANIQQNVTSLADEYPEVTFYYFLTPYSVAWWQSLLNTGTLDKQIEAERIVIEEILKHNNIKLYSFNCIPEITTDLNNYKDTQHYGEWINSLILRYMSEDKCLLTIDNYEQYLEREKQFYISYDYEQLNDQEDYANDYYAAALCNKEINGVLPLFVDIANKTLVEVSNAQVFDEQHNGHVGIVCQGSLKRPPDSEETIAEYLRDKEYVGFKYVINDASQYKYIVFYGKKVTNHGQVGVYIYDDSGNKIEEYSKNYHDLDGEWHQYLIDISQINGSIMVIFNGGYIDNTGSSDSKYVFSDITLY